MPLFGDADFTSVQNKFCVGKLAVVDGGKTCIIHLTSTAGEHRTDILHEYTAMNLCGFLSAAINPHNILSSDAQGAA